MGDTNNTNSTATPSTPMANGGAGVGGNVMNAVFDGTALRLWVSYAGGKQEAYQRPYVFLDLATLDANRDGVADFIRRHAFHKNVAGRLRVSGAAETEYRDQKQISDHQPLPNQLPNPSTLLASQVCRPWYNGRS